MAILAGLVLLLPGFFTLFHGADAGASLPGWLIRDLIGASVSGAVLMCWGATTVRQRQSQIHDLTPLRIRSRR